MFEFPAPTSPKLVSIEPLKLLNEIVPGIPFPPKAIKEPMAAKGATPAPVLILPAA